MTTTDHSHLHLPVRLRRGFGGQVGAPTGGGTGIEYDYAYSEVHQLKSQTTNASLMQFEPSNTEAISYVVNNLNQYTSVTTDGNPATITHDQNGNLTG